MGDRHRHREEHRLMALSATPFRSWSSPSYVSPGRHALPDDPRELELIRDTSEVPHTPSSWPSARSPLSAGPSGGMPASSGAHPCAAQRVQHASTLNSPAAIAAEIQGHCGQRPRIHLRGGSRSGRTGHTGLLHEVGEAQSPACIPKSWRLLAIRPTGSSFAS